MKGTRTIGRKKLSDYLRSNVIGLAALFVALSGTAWAAGTIGSGDIRTNAVLSKHIKQGQVKTPDLGDGAVRSASVASDSLTGDDIDESSLDIAGRSESTNTDCKADAAAETCVTQTITLARPAAVLVTASVTGSVFELDDGASAADSPALVSGQCLVSVDGTLIEDPDTSDLTNASTLMRDPIQADAMALTAVTSVGPGSHTFALRCLTSDGDIDFLTPSISAVALGNL